MSLALSFGAPILSMFLVGLAVRGVLGRGKALDEAAWLQVPFVGIAVTVLVLQFQLYLDIPVNRGVLALGGIVVALWGIWLWRGQVLASLRNIPLLPLAICLAVLLVQTGGLIRAGGSAYAGRFYADQCNYTSMAECFRWHGYAFDYEDIGASPWLGRVVFLKQFRLGQSVLQAYHSIISRMDTASQFMPTILLSCPLIALALYAVGRQCGLARWQAALAAFGGGVMPGVSMLVQENFLSHALGIPFLLMLPALLGSYNTQRDFGTLMAAGLGLGALASIYTEFLLMEVLLVLGFLVVALAQKPRSWQHALGFLVLLAAPWLCNPLYGNMTDYLTSALLTAPKLLAHLYPWGYGNEAFGVLWFGDFWLKPAAAHLSSWVVLLGTAAAAVGAIGLWALAVTAGLRWLREGRQTGGGFDLALAVLGLSMIPAVMAFQDRDHPYQFFKVLITVSPLLGIGTVFLAALLARAAAACSASRPALGRVATACIWLLVLGGLGTAATASARMALRSADPAEEFRSYQHIALNPNFRGLQRQLEGMRDQNILFRPASDCQGYQQIWALYFARQNKVWLTYPWLNDFVDLDAFPRLAHLADLSQLPTQCLVLRPRQSTYLLPPPTSPSPEIVWQNEDYIMWKYDGRPWVCLTHIDNPNGMERQDVGNVWLGGGETGLRLFATQSGVARMRIVLANGPCVDPGEKLLLQVQVGSGKQVTLEASGGPLVLPVAVQRGLNRVSIEVLNKASRQAGADPRPLLASFRVEEIDFQPQGQGESTPGPLLPR